MDYEAPMKYPCVYILSSKRNGTLYVGVTSNLVQRVWQHKEGLADGFTKEHSVKSLVWYEQHETMESAIKREKAIKEWQREWKCKLIQKTNPYWRDLYEELL
jgi:putative endonuclease